MFLLVFHIIYSSIFLKLGVAHAVAFAVAGAVGLMSVAESVGWLPALPLRFRGAPPLL